MKKTGFLFDERYLIHDTVPYHPEVSDRLLAAYQGIKTAGLLEKLVLFKGVRADLKWVEQVHDPAYIARFGDACVAGKKELDTPDCQMCAETYEIALLAVGGILDALRRMMEGEIDNAFCPVRPPGHHAEHNKAMGFCYFNNVAIAARYLQKQWGIGRVGIVDFDVHHGNGTQHLFEEDPTVFYYSIHQHPSFAFPGTGREFEEGVGAGAGYTKNSPVLPGQGDEEYRRLIIRDLIPAFETFQPEVILVSTGFDAHEDDEMADMRVTTEGFSWIMETIVGLADTHAGGRLVSILEGGYSLQRLPELVGNHVRILLGEPPETLQKNG
jgi:acetoin utilization deacetylase AcuC-like enzyme